MASFQNWNYGIYYSNYGGFVLFDTALSELNINVEQGL